MGEIGRDILSKDILNQKSVQNTDNSKPKQFYKQQLRCYVCNSPNHLTRDCKVQKAESEGKSNLPRKNRVIRGSNRPGVEASSPEKNQFQKVVEILFPSNSTTSPTVGQGTCQGEEGSPQSVTVKIEGIPVTGIIDTGSDISIVSGDLLKTVVNAAELKKEDFKPANK